jgi:putative ABC transport system substrate-binding protein
MRRRPPPGGTDRPDELDWADGAGNRKTRVEAGGLMSYGATRSEVYTMAAEQAAKILDGALPSALPLRQATRFELVMNNRTAKALGLTIPPSVLGRADQVIE